MVRIIILKNETVDVDGCKSQRVFRIINCKSLKELNLSTNWFSFFDCAELISK